MVLEIMRKRRARKENARSLYRRLVEQSRCPEFYTDLGVSDDVDGRFDMILIHTFLVLNRLQAEGREAKDLSQDIFGALTENLDIALREMGVGDLSVGKRMKGMARAFYGRMDAYQNAVTNNDQAALAEAIGRNLFRERDIAPTSKDSIAGYILRQVSHLKGQDFSRFQVGLVDFQPVELADAA